MEQRPKITKLKAVRPEDSLWCNEGIAFRVQNGLNRLITEVGPADLHECRNSFLTLNGKPLTQARVPTCPTCAGMLATGYGRDSIPCEEMAAIRAVCNEGYRGIEEAYEALQPLLALLADGCYLLADALLYPTDGQQFFCNVPNKLSCSEAFCDTCFAPELLDHIDGFPAFLYPTQPAQAIVPDRVAEYRNRLKAGIPLRGLAYYIGGFTCALLDGHHKAIAAAQLGLPCRCLTIIRANSYRPINPDAPFRGKIRCFSFCGVEITISPVLTQQDIFPAATPTKRRITPYALVCAADIPMDNGNLAAYPTILDLCAMAQLSGGIYQIDNRLLDGWITDQTEEACTLLRGLFLHPRLDDADCIYRAAVKVITSSNPALPHEQAWHWLRRHRREQVEQLAIDYLADHAPGDRCWGLAGAILDEENK